MTKYTLPNEMLDAMRDEPTFLRVKPDGFDDGGTIRPELTCTVLDAKFAKKLFEDGVLVHTSDDCKSDPKCPKCNDPRARKYLRLHIEVEGRKYQLDVPPSAGPRFLALARNGIDGALCLTCRRMETKDRVWGDISFEIVKEAA